jgi:hypothetical protein
MGPRGDYRCPKGQSSHERGYRRDNDPTAARQRRRGGGSGIIDSVTLQGVASIALQEIFLVA